MSAASIACLLAALASAAGSESAASGAESDAALPPDVRASGENGKSLTRWVNDHPQWFFGDRDFDFTRDRRLWVPYAVTGPALAIVEFVARPPSDARWRGDNGFDDEARDLLKGGSRSARESADTVSDVLLYSLGGAMLLDQVWLRGEHPVFRSLLIDGGWLLGNELLTRTVKVSAGRERPFVEPCRGDPDYVPDCDEGRNENASFFSGHASTTATLAGLICARHVHRSERGGIDWLACGAAGSASIATGMLRITAEQHHATDVIAGWASGALFGYVLPTAFDYGSPRKAPALSLRAVEPVASPGFLGLRYSVSF
jgi:membrane-associated phospholipid phosphatase